jgi:CHAD domain-containing protein
VLDEDRSAALDVELAWYAAALGELRDRHVLRDHLDAAVAALPAELVIGPVSARIHQLLDADLAQAQSALDEVMSSERYFALIRELRAWHEDPPVHTNRPGADAAQFLVAAKRTLRRRLRKARRAGEPDAAMHRARKAAKRLRYIAELCEPELGEPAVKARKRAKELQEQLGARQDSVVAAEFLRRAGLVAGTTPGENGFTFGLLYEKEQRGRYTD